MTKSDAHFIPKRQSLFLSSQKSTKQKQLSVESLNKVLYEMVGHCEEHLRDRLVLGVLHKGLSERT